MTKKVNIWMIVAIIFITLFLIENFILFVAFVSTLVDDRYESICITDICTPDISNSYNFDWELSICTCYFNGEEVKSVNMRDFEG